MTYPNVLVMGYLKATGQLTPETQAKLEQSISAGYQKLLSFEQPGGGFGWYAGHDPQNYLTAYALLILADMAKVYPVDEKVLRRTEEAVFRHQQGGSFGDVRSTAYVAWALLEAGCDSPKMADAVRWLEKNWSGSDAYSTALCANVFVRAKSGEARNALVELIRAAKLDKDSAYWNAEQTITYGRGTPAGIETTALATLALARGGHGDMAEKGLMAITRAKDAYGGWHSTQATVLSLKALIAGASISSKPEDSTVTVKLNGQAVTLDRITSKNWETVQQVALSTHLKAGTNTLELVSDSGASLGYQVVLRYHVPWTEPARDSEVRVETVYDKTSMRLDEAVGCMARITYRGPETFMLIVDVGLPSGFSPELASLDALKRTGRIDKYTLSGKSVTFYLGRVRPHQVVDLPFTVRPRFVVSTVTPPSRAYEYYNPENGSYAAPIHLTVRE